MCSSSLNPPGGNLLHAIAKRLGSSNAGIAVGGVHRVQGRKLPRTHALHRRLPALYP